MDHAHGPGHDHDHAHGHDHGRSRHHEERQQDRRRLTLALALTATIAVAEGIGGFWTGSLSLLSDAGHMVTDVSALVLSLLALWFASKPADPKRTYGYYRLEILSALANGVLLLLITVLIVVEAFHRLRSPSPVTLGPMAAIAAVGLLANLVSLSFLRHSHTLNVRSAFLHVLGDTLSSVAVVVGAGLMAWTGWWWIDPALSAAISVVIVAGAWRLLRESVDVLLEGVPSHVELTEIRSLMQKVEGVVSVHDLHVWTISNGIHALSAHLVVNEPSACNNDTILSAVKHDLAERFGIDHTTIQIESESYAHIGEVH